MRRCAGACSSRESRLRQTKPGFPQAASGRWGTGLPLCAGGRRVGVRPRSGGSGVRRWLQPGVAESPAAGKSSRASVRRSRHVPGQSPAVQPWRPHRREPPVWPRRARPGAAPPRRRLRPEGPGGACTQAKFPASVFRFLRYVRACAFTQYSRSAGIECPDQAGFHPALHPTRLAQSSRCPSSRR